MPPARRSTSRKAPRKKRAATPGSSANQSRPGVDSVRRAVERTVHTTVGSAGLTRDRAQEVVDEVVHRAERAGRGVREAGQRRAEAAAGVSERVRDALTDLRQLTGDEMKELRGAIERLASQVESLEARLAAATGLRRPGASKPAGPRSPARKPGATKSAPRKRTAKKSTARKATAKKATAKKATAKKSTARKSTARKSTAKKSTAKKSTARKPTARKSTGGSRSRSR